MVIREPKDYPENDRPIAVLVRDGVGKPQWTTGFFDAEDKVYRTEEANAISALLVVCWSDYPDPDRAVMLMGAGV